MDKVINHMACKIVEVMKESERHDLMLIVEHQRIVEEHFHVDTLD